MLKSKKFYILIVGLALLQACGADSELAQEAWQSGPEETVADAPPPAKSTEGVDLAAHMNLDQPGRKFLKTSQIQFQVENTRQATRRIEDICAQYDGFITHTNLRSEVSRTQQAKISQDSSLVKEYYTVQNEMTLRVPQQNLDSVIRAFSPLVSFLHYRILSAEDVQLKLLAEEMQKKRDQSLDKRLEDAIQKSEDAPLDEVRDTEVARHQQQTHSDLATLERMKLEDKIAYSELSIYFYQPEVYRTYQIAHVNPIAVPFSQQMALAFQRSLHFMQALVLVFIEVWYLLFIGGLLLYGYYHFIVRASDSRAKA